MCILSRAYVHQIRPPKSLMKDLRSQLGDVRPSEASSFGHYSDDARARIRTIDDLIAIIY